MTYQDIDALVQLALRAPRSEAESLWLSALLQRLAEQRKAQEAAEATQQAEAGAVA